MSYSDGIDVLGADTPKAILIRVRNAGQLARQHGGMATLAQTLAPSMIESKVYDEMAKSLKTEFGKKGVDAEVGVVVPEGYKSSSSGFWMGMAAGGASVGALALLWKLIGRRK